MSQAKNCGNIEQLFQKWMAMSIKLNNDEKEKVRNIVEGLNNILNNKRIDVTDSRQKTAEYNVTVKTGDNLGSGTDDDISGDTHF